MLSADYLDILPDPLLQLLEEFQTSVIEDISWRIAEIVKRHGELTATVEYQVQVLIESGMLYREMLQKIAQKSKVQEQVLMKLFHQAMQKSLAADEAIYRAAGVSVPPSPVLRQIIELGLRRTMQTFTNLTLSTAVSAQQSFIHAADLAFLQVSTGALGYEAAIREAVKQVADQGLHVLYPSGHKDKIDVAVRRTVLTGVNQTAGELSLQRAEDMDADLLQTSAHLGARNRGDVPENHEMWQGKVFTRGTRSENSSYPNFFAVTGYGSITGLCGINCRHSFYPFFRGLSAAAYPVNVLEEYADATVEYNGRDIDYYTATQMQRQMERDIRQARRELAAVQSAGLSDTTAEQQKLRANLRRIRDFIEQTKLPRQGHREKIY